MTGPIWVFDSSSLIEIKSTPRPRREALFDALARLVVAGRLKFPRQVLRELSKRDDVVKSWAVQQKTAILDPPTFDQLKLVLITVPDVIDPRKDTGEDEADPFVLALHLRAGHQDVRIVTQESKDRMAKAEEIDAAIMRHADTELLFDKPYEDNKRIRVTGPFTVESLAPHRVLSTDVDRPRSEAVAQRDNVAGFETMILDNLRKAGVQNTVKNERLVFDRLDPLAGTWLQASGSYADADGRVRRVAVSIGPEHGTVGPSPIKEAAKEVVQGVGYDVLVVCGFAFDPHVSEEARRYGKLQVLIARMNPDLSMGDELLKKTGAGNLFMVFGEPDVRITPADDKGNYQAHLNGVDVYDPTTGQIRSSSTDDIACWFIDTNYDGESFFVRHAYFTGADEPYEKLKRALRAEIDEASWSTLYSTVSRPIALPETGKIAVKVINHYGSRGLTARGFELMALTVLH